MGLTANHTAKRNYSKYDTSGTDPNRYASVSNTTEADSYLHKGKKSIVPGLRVNVSTPERILMVLAGGYLLYRALKKDDKRKITEGITGGTMLLRGISGYCPAYDAIESTHAGEGKNIVINTSLTINRPVKEVYNIWRQLENIPMFMKHLDSVTQTDAYISEWKAKIPGGLGATVSWTAEILMDEPNQLLSWHSMPGSTVNNNGKIRFTDRGDSTDLEVTISYHAPMGKPGEAVAKLLTPLFESRLRKDIENFKEYMETGILSE
jgi:uncharacterized membrane protein